MNREQRLAQMEVEFLKVAKSELNRLSQWFYGTPLLVSGERLAEMQSLMNLLYRAICFFVEHYKDCESFFPLSPKSRKIIEIASRYPYRAGTYRPDFLIDEDGKIHICEINARFPLNGYFVSGFAEVYANELLAAQGADEPQRQTAQFFRHLFEYFGGDFRRVCALKSPSDKPIDIRYYSQVFQGAGFPFISLDLESLPDNLDLLEGSAVVNELNQMDMERLDESLIEAIAASNSLNDLRTIFLAHDKRFLAVLSNREFLSRFLSETEIDFLTERVAPTYTRAQRPDLWEQARKDKANWLIKPYLLGKSQNLHAGCVARQKDWDAVFESEALDGMVLQPFIRQKQFVSELGGRKYQDYVVGTLLGFDDRFFGPGISRASSFPVTNQGDDRKVVAAVCRNSQIQTDFIL